MTALILQARLDSRRLPNKALLPLAGRPLILRVMQSLRRVSADVHLLACPADAADAFAPLAAEAGFIVVVGPKDDVLARYLVAIEQFRPDWVVRATGDNPFVFADAVAPILAEALALGVDYAAYSGMPYGAGVEIVSANALREASRKASLFAEREHVCPYLYNHPEAFLLHRPAAPRRWQGRSLRITVDLAEDLERAERLFAALGGPADGKKIISRYQALFGAAGTAAP